MMIETDNLILHSDSGLIGTYHIYERVSNKLIGMIIYRGYHYDKKLGDIGYLIHQSYCNKGYGKEAILNLIELLCLNGISDFWITCDINNVISKHIINNYLNVLEMFECDGYFRFKCSTKKEFKKGFGI